MNYIIEPQKNVEICDETDICVIGGSCTGVFAAIRAARLGAKVTIVEKQNCFGGVATSGLVNVWHSLYDFDNKNQIISGLTYETISRLKSINAITEDRESRNACYKLNTQELKIELDNLVKENKIKVYLHTFYSSVLYENNEIQAVIIENKSGRKAIKAKFYIDATGDGDIARDLAVSSYRSLAIQPPSACFYMLGETYGMDLGALIKEHGHEVGLVDDWGWCTNLLPNKNISMRADNHVFNVMCNNADDLTYSEIEGRRQMRALITLLNKYGGRDEEYTLLTTCSHIGIRETSHYETKFKATETDLLLGVKYNDAILNGTYRIDIHHADDNGITFKELNGNAKTVYGKGGKPILSNWREDMGLSGQYAQYYQVPFEILVDHKFSNFIAVGRMVNADDGAFGALRVMVNLNQMGEAAGVAAFCSIDKAIPIQNINGVDVRSILIKGGSAL